MKDYSEMKMKEKKHAFKEAKLGRKAMAKARGPAELHEQKIREKAGKKHTKAALSAAHKHMHEHMR